MAQSSSTVVLQSYRATAVPPWLTRCMNSVRAWAEQRGHTYRFVGDELFAPLSPAFRVRTEHLPMMMADLGRLVAAQDLLAGGAERVVWVDADVLVVAPERLTVPTEHSAYACRELWVEPSPRGVVVDERVNNCVLVFTRASQLLPFYIEACEDIVERTSGALSPLALGTRFLTALDRGVPLAKIDTVALLSPFVLRELAEGTDGPLLGALRARSLAPMAAVNLCASFRGKTIASPVGPSFVVDDAMYEAAIARLLGPG